MFSIDKSVPVNANLKPGDPALTRDHIWEGLLMKAYDAKPFVHLMTKCEVTREFENGIERDIVFRGIGADRAPDLLSEDMGSTAGNFVPTLWGGDAISVSGFLWSLAGGILGIWIGYRFGQSY